MCVFILKAGDKKSTSQLYHKKLVWSFLYFLFKKKLLQAREKLLSKWHGRYEKGKEKQCKEMLEGKIVFQLE